MVQYPARESDGKRSRLSTEARMFLSAPDLILQQQLEVQIYPSKTVRLVARMCDFWYGAPRK